MATQPAPTHEPTSLFSDETIAGLERRDPERAEPTAPAEPAAEPIGGRIVEVVPDVAGIEKRFHYVVPERFDDAVELGTMVRIELGGRRVGGWVTALDVEPIAGVELHPIAKVRGVGPDAAMIELAEWAAWRWRGRVSGFLGTASPENTVTRLPDPPRPPPTRPVVAHPMLIEAFAGDSTVVRIAPGSDRFNVALSAVTAADQAMSGGVPLLLCPTHDMARHLTLRLRRSGLDVALLGRDWAKARAGTIAVGTRSAAFAPVANLGAIVVFDEHDESYVSERSPTWNARDVALERARRAGISCVLVSPIPTLEAQSRARLVVGDRAAERAGWPIADVVDMRDGDPMRSGLYSPRLVELMREPGRVLCVLNRKGRARLLACAACGDLAACDRCDASVHQGDDGLLTCGRCASVRPVLCAHCGATKLKLLRVGIGRAREELEALAGESVGEVSGAPKGPTDHVDPDAHRVWVGTEAVLHQVGGPAALVAYLDFDAELFQTHYRARELALSLLVRGARLVGGRGRDTSGRLLIQTRTPADPVIEAAVHGDPDRLMDSERQMRTMLGLPPTKAVARISGAVAGEFVSALEAVAADAEITIVGPIDDAWLVSADDHQHLCDGLALPARPPGRMRIEVDPLRM